jgi:hypothetical protein
MHNNKLIKTQRNYFDHPVIFTSTQLNENDTNQIPARKREPIVKINNIIYTQMYHLESYSEHK